LSEAVAMARCALSCSPLCIADGCEQLFAGAAPDRQAG
jgi:hypothetical protein